MQTLTIGQVARQAGIGGETVRFYEREGLLAAPARRASGYREFDLDAISQLKFIKQAQGLGFTLREIKELLALKLDPKSTRAQVREQAEAKVADIERRIAEKASSKVVRSWPRLIPTAMWFARPVLPKGRSNDSLASSSARTSCERRRH